MNDLTDEKALKILQLKGTNVNEYTFKQLKTQFRILALNYHPDKQSNISNETQKEYHNKFIKIKDAFDYLISRLEKTNKAVYDIDKEVNETEFTFYDLFILLIRFMKRSFKDEVKLKSLLFEWIKTYNIKLKTLLEIKRFIDLNETYLFITPTLIKVLNEVIENIRRENKIRYYEIHPTIDDILNGNFYILEENGIMKTEDGIHENIENEKDNDGNEDNEDNEGNNINENQKKIKKYYIPLWHHQLFFGENYDIEVSIIPDVHSNIFIDEENNLYFKLVCSIQDVLKNKGIQFNLSNLNFFIEAEKIKCIKQQTITIKNKGIYKIDKNYLNPTNRNDIIVLLELK